MSFIYFYFKGMRIMLFKNTQFSKHKSKILITCMLLIFIFGITSSFAVDVDDVADSLQVNDEEISIDENGVDLANQQLNNNILSQDSGSDDVLEDDDAGTFSQLRSAIGSLRYVELTKDYNRSGFSGSLTYNYGLTIDGKGHTLNSQNGASIFEIDTHEYIHFKNITFTNCNGYALRMASNYAGNIILEDCTFINTHGAIYYYQSYGNVEKGYLKATFQNLNIINNTMGSAAIYLVDEVEANFTNVNFTNVTCDSNPNNAAAAIYISQTFKGNIDNVNVYNSKSKGGSMYFGGIFNGTFTNCNFANCEGTGSYGGAIHTGSEFYCNFTNVTFTDCVSKGQGGAIYFDNTFEGNFTNVSFDNADAHSGGAIYTTRSFTSSFKNVNFTNCDATSGNGGALYLYNSNVDVSFESVNCINNSANYNYGSDGGGAFYISGCKNLSFKDVNFTNNRFMANSNGGGAVYATLSTGNPVLYQNVKFTDNYANYNGGAVYLATKSMFVDCEFRNNSAKNYGGAIYAGTSFNATNCNFTENTAKYGSAFGANNLYNIQYNVDNSRFTKNTGDVIYIYQSTRYVPGSINISNSVFEENNGDSIYSQYNTNVTNCNFTNNNGRAFYLKAFFKSSTKNRIDNVICINNTAPRGSAIYNTNSQLNITNSKFLLNKANSISIPVDYDKYYHAIIVSLDAGNNLINAIYSDVDVNFMNVVYYNYNDTVNSDEVYPHKGYVPHAPMVIEVYSSETELYETFTVSADENGTCRLPYQAPLIHHIKAYHVDDD